MFFTRLAAAATACAILIAAVIYPAAPAGAGAHLAALGDGFQRGPLADKACPLAGSIITQPFADLADVLSVSPLGGVTAPGEALPAPAILNGEALPALVNRNGEALPALAILARGLAWPAPTAMGTGQS